MHCGNVSNVTFSTSVVLIYLNQITHIIIITKQMDGQCKKRIPVRCREIASINTGGVEQECRTEYEPRYLIEKC